MFIEFLATLGFALGLMAIGIGPALLLSPRQDRVLQAAAVAPVMGLAMLSILAYPLVRFVCPTRVWAFPLVVILVLASAAIVWRDYRLNRDDYRLGPRWRMPISCLLISCVCLTGLAAPMLFGGMQYALYRSNPSDAFLYMSIADSTRLADWDLILESARFGRTSEASALLAGKDPTALFTARFHLHPLQITPAVILGMLSEVSRVPVHRLFYSFQTLSLFLAVPVLMVLGRSLNLGRWVSGLLAVSLPLGFWADMLREHDALATVVALPLSLLVLLNWIRSEGVQSVICRERVSLAVAVAALFAAYQVHALLLCAAFFVYVLLTLLERRGVARRMRDGAFVASAAVLILLATGQLPHLFKAMQYFLERTQSFTGGESEVQVALQRSPALTATGALLFLDADLNAALPVFVKPALMALAYLVLVAWAVSYLATIATMHRVDSRVLQSLCLLHLFLLLWYASHGRNYSVVKCMFSFFPYLILTFTLATRAAVEIPWMGARARRAVSGSLTVLFILWACGQAAIPLAVSGRARRQSIVDASVGSQRGGYELELGPLVRELEERRPKALLVDIPISEDVDWWFALYCAFAFKEFPGWFRSGIIWDNSNERSIVPARPPPASWVPDYAVVSMRDDPFAGDGRAKTIGRTRNLVLYQLSAPNDGNNR